MFTTKNVCVLNANVAIASRYNTRYKKDGSVLQVGGVSYLFGKTKEGPAHRFLHEPRRRQSDPV